jgi:hypothetical protein
MLKHRMTANNGLEGVTKASAVRLLASPEQRCFFTYYCTVTAIWGHAAAYLFETLTYKTEGRKFDS